MTAPQISCAVVLCAGLGVRLRPLTEQRPKPLLRFLDRPIAEYAVGVLEAAGVRHLGVNAHHLPERVERWLADLEASRDGALRTTLAPEPTLLGTGGGARSVYQAMGAPRGTVAVMNGDIVADVDLNKLWKVHRRSGAVATLLTIPRKGDETAVYVDEGRHFIAQLPSTGDVWTSTVDEPHHAVTFGGVYLCEPEVFGMLPDGASCLIREGVGPLLARGARVAAVHSTAFWADLGTPKRFLSASLRVLEDPGVLSAAGLATRSDRRYVEEPKRVVPGAELEGPVFVAAGATIERGARVGPGVVVGEGCVVRAGAFVSQSVLMGGAIAEGEVHRRIVDGRVQVRVA